MACLANSIKDIHDAQCRNWLIARAVCVDDVREIPGCDSKATVHGIRHCIRHAPRHALSGVCANSSYYQSLFRHRRRVTLS